MRMRLEIRMPDQLTSHPGIVIESFSPGPDPKTFATLPDAVAYLATAFPGNELRAELEAWYVVAYGAEVARLVDDK